MAALRSSDHENAARAADAPGPQDIYSQALECKALFVSCLEMSSPYASKISACQNQFLTWASFLGVFASESASLDRRLEFNPEIKELVMAMLRVLKRNLELSRVRHVPMQPANTKARPAEEDDGAMYGITGAIDRLHRLAVAIRQSPRTDEAERVRNFASKQEPDDFPSIISSMMLFLFHRAESTLRAQLVDSIVYRRHRMLWARRHVKKLGQQRKVDEDSQPASKNAADAQASRQKNRAPAHDAQQRYNSKAEMESAYSPTLPSRRSLGRINKRLVQVQRQEAQYDDVRSARSSNPPPRAQYPKMPSVPDDKTKIVCQYCLGDFEFPPNASQAKKESLWIDHLNADLNPYVCVSEECSNYPTSFSSAKEWRAHMNESHGTEWARYIHRVTWLCPLCGDDAGSFPSEDLLVRHLTKYEAGKHPSVPDAFELSKLKAKGRVSKPRPADECPLCGPPPWNIPNKMGKEVETISGSPEDIHTHFIAHLQHLALLSISWWDEDVGVTPDQLPNGGDSSAAAVGFNSETDGQQLEGTGAQANLQNDELARLQNNQIEQEVQGQAYLHKVTSQRKRFAALLQRMHTDNYSLEAEVSIGDDSVQTNDLLTPLEKLQKRLLLDAEGAMVLEGQIGLILAHAIEPPYITNEAYITKHWENVHYAKLETQLRNAQYEVRSRERKQNLGSSSSDSGDSDFESWLRYPKFPRIHLESDILENLETSNFAGRIQHFLPEGRIHRLITPIVVAGIFPMLNPESREDLDFFDLLLIKAAKVFGISVLLGITTKHLYQIMKHFQRCGFTDGMLPAPDALDGSQDSVLVPFNSKPWNRARRQKFKDTQWKFLSPVFLSTNLKHHDLGPDYILPIMCYKRLKLIKHVSRSFDSVFEAKVHRNHLDVVLPLISGHYDQVEPDRASVAVYEWKADNTTKSFHRAMWEDELRVLKDLNRMNHVHIVCIYAAFTIREKHYIIVEWANGRSLRDLWSARSSSSSKLNAAAVREVLQQLHGLLDALCMLHKSNYRHSTLNAKSILRFLDGSTGLGTLKFKTVGSATRYVTPFRLIDAGDVTVPYTSIATKPHKSHFYNLWSMGCIILEWMIYLFYGHEELAEFDDMVWKVPEISEHEVVQTSHFHVITVACLDLMAKEPKFAGDTALKDLLDLMRTKVLVASPVRATELRDEIGKILRRAKNDQRYLFSDNIQGLGICAPLVARLKQQNETKSSQPLQVKEPQWMMPFPRNPDFVGRELILQQLLKKISPDDSNNDCQRTALGGLGGIGKTQIAIEAIFRLREKYPSCSIFWISAVNAASFENTYLEIGRRLGVAGIGEDKVAAKARVTAALGQKPAGSWLLVVDNVDDTQLIPSLFGYLPFSLQGSILFVTRNYTNTAKLYVPRDNIIHVTGLGQAEAVALLQTKMSENQKADVTSATVLVDLLANLPLAIIQASTYMAITGVSTIEYIESYGLTKQGLPKILTKDSSDFRRGGYGGNTVATTWLTSFENILRENKLGAQYLKFMCFLAEYGIPIYLLPPAQDKLERDEAIGILQAYDFISGYDGDKSFDDDRYKSFDFHRLVRLVVQDRVEEAGEKTEYVTAVIQRLVDAGPLLTDDVEIWKKYLRHVKFATEFREDCSDVEAVASLISKQGDGHRLWGDYKEAEKAYQEVFELREKILGKEHPSTRDSMSDLAVVLGRQGKYQEDALILGIEAARGDGNEEKDLEIQKHIMAFSTENVKELVSFDAEYFDLACQQLYSHVRGWVIRFSEISDPYDCQPLGEIDDSKILDRLNSAVLDGSDVNVYLYDRVKRRDIFTSMTMAMIWEFVFTPYLFGMRDTERQMLKSLETILLKTNPLQDVRQWRAVALTLASRTDSFREQRDLDTQAAAFMILKTLRVLLPPSIDLNQKEITQLYHVVEEAVRLSIEMRCQRPEYQMLPPLQSNLTTKIEFNANLMNECSGDTKMSNEEIEATAAIVLFVLFPLVVQKGDDKGLGDDEMVVCPAQVIVANGLRVSSSSPDRSGDPPE
ncbi:hypothetical protein F5Y19DRAFT_412147 [Xylariaceae sp. FL1651]|nr:hypothetical protein F5Y19DRAFT_412147 [Xylariaceae sp. FL1651]